MTRYTVLLFTVLLFLAACNNDDKSNGNPPETPDNGESSVQAISYSIAKQYPHNASSFTQGLVIYKGKLYEGTGNRGESKLMEVDLNTGKALKSINLPEKYFGEGIAILNDTVYQLTWQENVVFVYTLPDFKKVKEFPIATEGWGITTDGKNLIVSDGTSNLYFYEPATFDLLRSQSVRFNGALAFKLNELEYINGYVYANQWESPFIYKIDPSNGSIVGQMNLQDIWNNIRKDSPKADVPNGIAYDADTKKTYITGKWWPSLYEIEFSH